MLGGSVEVGFDVLNIFLEAHSIASLLVPDAMRNDNAILIGIEKAPLKKILCPLEELAGQVIVSQISVEAYQNDMIIVEQFEVPQDLLSIELVFLRRIWIREEIG